MVLRLVPKRVEIVLPSNQNAERPILLIVDGGYLDSLCQEQGSMSLLRYMDKDALKALRELQNKRYKRGIVPAVVGVN